MIRTSPAGEVERLVSELQSSSQNDRDAAVVKLRIIGARALERLSALIASSAPAVARAAAFAALEGSTDPLARDLALNAIDAGADTVATAAIAVLRGWVVLDAGGSVLDALTRVAVDAQRTQAVRLAALDALSELPEQVVQPIILQVSREIGVVTRIDEPLDAREWLAAHADAPLSQIDDAIREMRDRERGEPSERRRQEWRAARGVAHALLAARGSRVAVYDLRETLDAAREPLPGDFLKAASAVGDASCLEPLARTWDACPQDTWWRDRVRETAAAIVARERLSGRHAVIKRIKTRWPDFL